MVRDDPGAPDGDALLGGQLRLLQPAKGHRAGTDAVLLAAATPVTTGLVIDVGAGVGTVGLAIARRDPLTRVTLLERDPMIASFARQNIAQNGLGERVCVAEASILAALPRRNAGVKNESADVVVTNPPFYDAARVRASPISAKRDAHVLEGDLETWMRASIALLTPGGALCVIHRAEALAFLLAAMRGLVGEIRVRAVHPRSDAPASRVLVTARKGSRASLAVLPALILHDADGAFTQTAADLHAGVGNLT